MTKFKVKNLPKEFEFPLTKHELRDFLKTVKANFEMIEFAGISSTESFYNKNRQNTMLWVCYLQAEYRETAWFFRLQVDGLRTERYEERREEIAQKILAQIKNWVDKKTSSSDTASKKLCRAHVYFDLTRSSDDIAKLSEWS